MTDQSQERDARRPPVVSVVAKSGTGKTTLIEKLIAELKRRGYRVGAIKHDAHDFEIDHEGKDSWRLTRAGADTTLISSKTQTAMVRDTPGAVAPPIDTLVTRYFDDVDIVLTEGFKRGPMPKIEVHRAARSAELLCRGPEHDPTLIAVASDDALDPALVEVPIFGLNDAAGICDLLEARFITAGS